MQLTQKTTPGPILLRLFYQHSYRVANKMPNGPTFLRYRACAFRVDISPDYVVKICKAEFVMRGVVTNPCPQRFHQPGEALLKSEMLD